ncbi:C-type lectin domain family 4 member E-like isoform X2 [Oncorhynchus tshawytscha]|uniref:C-type lectin domain-containing protein n=1 Tax=Oncorhynchus tshawytscha TaxID=74940 RepID=A0AAZ3S6Z4_ONCTS|nr:C-type lectin domain family 4 member E-like isoform X2 [Oncorhynchus tshawytscha]
MSEGVYEISDGFEDEPDAIKNTDIDGQSYANVRAFKPSPRDVVVASDGVIGHHDSKLREQLQTSYNTMTKERDQLQTERDVLSGWLTSLKQTCPERWQKFESSCYFLSTETKTWKESREDCLQRGADLVIINNNKEQEFLFILNHTTAVHVWIGLTDSVTEGTWRWVDGTPLTTPRYWSSHQPDNGDRKPEYGVEDCVQIRKDQSPLEAWNDVSCRSKLNWVCEKVF